ncbi:MAG: hypothetical protein MR025_02675 [Helicobacter trogontum]|uniref:hypothetical protein n=1 Tax=Helicobacter trogontum TaxID=50960 RepID=UPI00242B0955|nr:hypothetical protein [Helicobacter trogontum]MCI5786340.1 hypothetical protein [Helicobacter trogontum]
MQNYNEITHYNATNTATQNVKQSSIAQQESKGIGLLPLVHEVKQLLETKHNKKIEDLEFKLLEKEEKIAQMELEISTLKAQDEEKDIEIYRMREEINESKRLLEQFVTTLNRTQE